MKSICSYVNDISSIRNSLQMSEFNWICLHWHLNQFHGDLRDLCNNWIYTHVNANVNYIITQQMPFQCSYQTFAINLQSYADCSNFSFVRVNKIEIYSKKEKLHAISPVFRSSLASEIHCIYIQFSHRITCHMRMVRWREVLHGFPFSCHWMNRELTQLAKLCGIFNFNFQNTLSCVFFFWMMHVNNAVEYF